LLYMIIEHFKNRILYPYIDASRIAGDWLRRVCNVSSWVDEKLERCFQLMETEHRKYLDEWIANWNDLVEFEVYPVMSSTEAAEKVSSRL